MCIICVKPAGVGIPSLDRMKTCFSYNSDGAGVMYPVAGDKVKISKGYMAWEDFEAMYNKLKTFPKSTPMVFHFRIGTHGKTKHPSFCHPFPVTYDIDDMSVTRATTSIGVAHNGIIDTIDFRYGGSDTMDFIAGILYPLLIRKASLKEPTTDLILQNILGTSNKLAVMYGSGRIETFGNFITADDGCLYSNSTYEPYTYALYTGKKSKHSKLDCPRFEECYNAWFDCHECTAESHFLSYGDASKKWDGAKGGKQGGGSGTTKGNDQKGTQNP